MPSLSFRDDFSVGEISEIEESCREAASSRCSLFVDQASTDDCQGRAKVGQPLNCISLTYFFFLSTFQELDENLVESLTSILGEKRVSLTEPVREQHGRDEGPYEPMPPQMVVFPETTDEVSEVAKACYSFNVPMIPFGTGTGLEGGTLALNGGVCLDLMRMHGIGDVHAEDFFVSVRPGVTRLHLNRFIKDHGLWFPVDPGADASLCGMCATSASGTNAVKYGTMKENVLNLEVVLADGRVLHTAGKDRCTKKSSAGYNLTNLFLGSEGTLGIITEATLKLHAIPETMLSAICSFPSVKSAVETTIQIMSSSIPVARIELLDEEAMKACNAYSKTDYEIAPTLFFEFHGSEASVEAEASLVGDLSEANGGSGFRYAKTPEDRSKLWKARHDMYYAILSTKPGYRAVITDVCVPVSQLETMITETQHDFNVSGLSGPILGHVGDGNFHSFVMFDPEDDSQLKAARELASRMARRALALKGTCTGEHGVGWGKKPYLDEELGGVNVDVMRQIKAALDPKNLMNPGKVF
ncbi:unnamed protein product [Notodromas monacha]|uniref:Probable D-lactate dehydrogenase, mitochondrial n=2 Tax=Notodromas monacha TaxID=399045 RepID=A0A7R9BQK0_9CRUS|nr:unnamed protein product [Notodromas monacha]CAG0918485.1 unnamed protein product [Notodromas monacha]